MATTSKGIYYPNDYTKVADVPADMKALAKSVDTVIDDINNDINLANRNLANVIQLAMTNQKKIDTEHETNTQQDKDIANLKTENEELKAENERLRQDMNAYPSNTAEGEYITLNDSADSRFNKFTIKGNSVQKITTQSANVWSDNTTRTFDNSHRVQSVNLKPNIKAGTYKFSCDISNLVLGTNTGLHLASEIVYEDDSTDDSFYLIPFNAIKENIRYSNSITIEKNIKSISLKVGATQTTNGGSMTVSNFCLRADDSDEYVEFVPDSPSTDYKSDIQNITDNIDIISCNENLALDGYSTPKTDTDFYSSVSSNFTPLEDGWGRFELDNTKGNNNNYVNAFISFKKFKNIIKLKTSYKLLVEFRNINMSGSSNEDYMCITTGSGSEPFVNCQFYKNDLSKNLRYSKKLNPYPYDTNITHLFRSFLSVSPGNSTSLEVRISLLEANSTEAEVKVENQEFIFPLSEGQKMYEESYLASDGIHHKRKQVKLIPSDWTTNMPLSGTFYFRNSSSHIWDYTGLKGICTHFQNAENENVTENYSARNYLEDNQCNVRNADIKDRIYFKNSAFTTVEQWRDFFNNNDVLFEYECEEYVEAYTDEQQAVYDEIVKTAKSYKIVTNIFSTNEVSPKFEIEYRQDIKALINNVSQAVLNNA